MKTMRHDRRRRSNMRWGKLNRRRRRMGRQKCITNNNNHNKSRSSRVDRRRHGWQAAGHYAALNCMQIALPYPNPIPYTSQGVPVYIPTTILYYESTYGGMQTTIDAMDGETKNAVIGIWGSLFDSSSSGSRSAAAVEGEYWKAIYACHLHCAIYLLVYSSLSAALVWTGGDGKTKAWTDIVDEEQDGVGRGSSCSCSRMGNDHFKFRVELFLLLLLLCLSSTSGK